MTKKKKLVKQALQSPERYAPAELTFFQRWLAMKKEIKQRKKEEERKE